MRSNVTVRYFHHFIKRFSQLTQKERYVLVKRLKSQTLEQIGKKLNVTEGRIRQIEKVAIEKIKQKSQQLSLFK